MSTMVAGYETDNSQLMSMVVATTSTQTATIIAEAASEQSVSDVASRVTALEALNSASSAGDCIPYIEFTRGSTCVPLSPPCRAAQYEAAHPTRTSDRVCRAATTCSSTQYETAPAERMYDRSCTNLTVCNSSAYQDVAPTTTSDRTCVPAPSRCIAGITLGLTTLSTNGVQRSEYCLADGSSLGGNGTARANAGKSCFTIRHGHAVTADGARWVYENDVSSPFQVFCDMINCGGDTAHTWSNRSQCGGWTMVMKAARGSSCANAHANSWWRTSATSATTTSRANACGKGPAYSRASFTDVMFGSMRTGHTLKNVAFRFPGNPTASMFAVLRGCTRKNDAKLIVPGYGNPSQNQVCHAPCFTVFWACFGCRRPTWGIPLRFAVRFCYGRVHRWLTPTSSSGSEPSVLPSQALASVLAARGSCLRPRGWSAFACYVLCCRQCDRIARWLMACLSYQSLINRLGSHRLT